VKLYSQARLEVVELNVSNITVNLHDSTWIEGEEEGPRVGLQCALYNQSDGDICLFPSKSRIFVVFNYMNKEYENEVFDLAFLDQNRLLVPRNGKADLFLSCSILLGTTLIEDKKEDYKMTLLGILPTLRVLYKDPNLNLFSTRICKVNINY
jgi:hypothetical protein